MGSCSGSSPSFCGYFMTIHVCRDLILGGFRGMATGSYDSMSALSIFLQSILNYTTQSVGGSSLPNLDPKTTISYYSGSGPFTVVSSSIIPGGTACAFISSSGGHTLLKFSKDMINLSAAATPTGWVGSPWPNQNPLSGSWVAVKSLLNPLANSGIFQITDVNSWLTQNAVEIDYRSTSTTIQETGSYVIASVYVPPPGSDEGSVLSGRGTTRTGTSWSTFAGLTDNGSSVQYPGSGSSTYPRVLFKSPSTLAWWLRLAIEPPSVIGFGGTESTTGPALSISPGLSGASGDYSPGQILGMTGTLSTLHLHGPQWFNASSSVASRYVGSMTCLDNVITPATGNVNPPSNGSSLRYGFYAWGDDVTGTCIVFLRNYRGGADTYAVFGTPEDETYVSGSGTIQRLFSIGQTLIGGGAGGVSWKCGAAHPEGISGIAYSLDSRNGLLSCVVGSLTYVALAASDGTNIRFDANAGDTPFLGKTEVISSDLYAGTLDNNRNYSDSPVFSIEPRRMGRFPIARFGRATGKSNWSAADDSLQWFHTAGGMYLPWGGLIGLLEIVKCYGTNDCFN